MTPEHVAQRVIWLALLGKINYIEIEWESEEDAIRAFDEMERCLGVMFDEPI